MPYITSVERIGIQKGIQIGREAVQQGIQQGIQLSILETLDERFGDIPSSISDDIRQIKDRNQLRILRRQAIWSRSIEDFRQQLRYHTSVERFGIQKEIQQAVQQGIQQALQLGILEILDERFGDIPPAISDDIRQIEDQSQLRTLHRQAIRSASIEDFRQQLRNQTNG